MFIIQIPDLRIMMAVWPICAAWWTFRFRREKIWYWFRWQVTKDKVALLQAQSEQAFWILQLLSHHVRQLNVDLIVFVTEFGFNTSHCAHQQWFDQGPSQPRFTFHIIGFTSVALIQKYPAGSCCLTIHLPSPSLPSSHLKWAVSQFEI